MEYVTLFEVGTSSHSSGWIGPIEIGLLFVFVSALLVWKPNLLSSNSDMGAKFNSLFSKVFFVLSVAWLFLIVFRDPDPDGIVDLYNSGRYDVVEGPVENFDPMPEYGSKFESFSVKGVKFSYSDFVTSVGFNNAASRGGPIREGMYVRVSYIGNVIVKLETLRGFDPPRP